MVREPLEDSLLTEEIDMNRAASLLTICFFAAFFAVTAQAGNILVNGSFGTGSLAPWTPFTTSNGTNGSGLPDVVMFNTTGTGATNSAQFNVGEVSFDRTQQGGGISESVTASASGMYSFFANIASQDDANGEVNSDAGTFSIVIDGTTDATDSLGAFSSPHQVILGTLSGSVDLTAGTHTFEILITRAFVSSGTATPEEYVTNLALNSPTSGVPEPATYALAGLALAGLALYRRKRA
jgi:hypothetical protein